MSRPSPKKKTTKKQSTLQISKAVLTPEFVETQIDFLDDEDLALCFDLRVLSKDGEEFQVKGVASIPLATRPESIKVVPQQFEQLVENSLLKPLLHRFNDYMNDQTENDLPPPPTEIPAALLDTATPAPTGEEVNGEEEENVTADPPADSSVMSE